MVHLGLYKRLILTSAEGKILSDSGWTPSHSFVLQFLQIVRSFASRIVTSVRGIDGVYESLPYFLNDCRQFAYTFTLRNDWSYKKPGIVVGTGTTAVAPDDYELETKIADGSGSGELVHGEMGDTNPLEIGSNVDSLWTRTFLNGSGASITVKEIGVHAITRNTSGSSMLFLILRDSVDQTILNTETLTIQYIFRTSA